jgi:hypothetical protein
VGATYWFNASRVIDKVRDALEDELDEAAHRIAADARQRAPIRKVFKEKRGFRFKTRALTAQEHAISTRLRAEWYGSRGIADPGVSAHYNRVQLPSRKSANTLAHSQQHRQLGTITRGRFTGIGGTTRSFSTRSGTSGYEPGPWLKARLTARGLNEIRSGSAVHIAETGKGFRAVQAGGALKASIDTDPVRETGTGVEAVVAARIRYAKFVEFPTIHNRAQPFLLPALKDEQRTFVRDVAAAIRRSLGGG